MNQIILILVCVISLKNHTAMPFQNIFQVWAVAFGAGYDGAVCRVADILLFVSGIGDLLILHDYLCF